VTSVWRVHGIARRAERAEGDWTDAARAAASHLGLRRPIRLLVSERVAAPATLGIVRAAVLLPARSDSWSAERRLAALLHELAHVRRRDCASQLVAQLACAVYWFNPLIWVAARALREEREHAADDTVLAAGVRASDYAGLLLDVAGSTPSSLPLPAASFAGRRCSHLERRVRSILDPRRPRHPAGRAMAVVGVLAVTCAVAPLASALPPVEPLQEATPLVAPPGEVHVSAATVEPAAATSFVPATRVRQGGPTTPSPSPAPTPAPRVAPRESRGDIAVEPGSQEEAVVAALEEALEDPDEGVRKQARWALDMIGIRNGRIPPDRGRKARRGPPSEVDADAAADAEDEHEDPDPK
jgi:hypothetical protein